MDGLRRSFFSESLGFGEKQRIGDGLGGCDVQTCQTGTAGGLAVTNHDP